MQSNFVTTLSIILLNVLIISCWRITVPTDQYEHSEIQFPDGALYNPNRIGGPVSGKMYEIHQQLAFLGQYNNKYWYIDRIVVNYATASFNCSSMGMSIARIDDQRELNFLYDVTLSTDTPWVGAVYTPSISSFKWDGTDDEYVLDSIRFTADAARALRFNRAANGLSSLVPLGVTSATRFSLCTIP